MSYCLPYTDASLHHVHPTWQCDASSNYVTILLFTEALLLASVSKCRVWTLFLAVFSYESSITRYNTECKIKIKGGFVLKTLILILSGSWFNYLKMFTYERINLCCCLTYIQHSIRIYNKQLTRYTKIN